MFHDTQPARLGADSNGDAGSEFRVDDAREVLALLRRLRDGDVPLVLSGPNGRACTSSIWSIDNSRSRLHLSAAIENPQLERLVDGDEVVAVAYLDSVKLQFDVAELVLVHGARGAALRSALPQRLYRFQRRAYYRVRPPAHGAPVARLRHPAIPDMMLELRIVDIGVGGCALLLPHDVPPLEPGIELAAVAIELDGETHFRARLVLQHVTAILPDERGVRIGCRWHLEPPHAERALQRYIDRAQRRLR
jgi:c-di-GMP-binding flagellar brake protein YcgR